MVVETNFYVVFDANILIRDFWLESESFEYLKKHRFLDHKPYVPEVVFKEVRNYLKLRAEQLLDNIKEDGSRSSGNNLRLIKLFNYSDLNEKNAWDIDSLLDRWESNLLSVLRKNKGGILPTVNIDLSMLVERSIERQKPFSKGDKGFRDTLIWLSTLNLTGPLEYVSFITGNKTDFFEKETRETAAEIKQEIRDKLGENRELLLHLSVDDFISKIDSDRTASADALQRALISEELAGFNLWGWIKENIIELTEGIEFDGIKWAGCPYHAEAPILTELDDLVSLDIPRLSHINDDVYRLYCDLGIIGIFQSQIAFEKVRNIVNPNQILDDFEDDSFWSTVLMRSVATFVIRLDFNVSSLEVESAYMIPLEHWDDFGTIIQEIDDYVLEIHEFESE